MIVSVPFQDEFEDWPLVPRTFFKWNPFFKGTSKSIQDLDTSQFLQCASFRGQQCELNQLTTFVSSLQLLLPVSMLGVWCRGLMQSFVLLLEHMVSRVEVSSTDFSTDF